MNNVFALRYATFAQRLSRDNFIIDDGCCDGVMPLDYYIWLIQGPGGNIVVDTGFNHEAGERRNRNLTMSPRAMLEAVGVSADSVSDVILTHLHYDHAGNLEDFPSSRFHIQAKEMAFATGCCMCQGYFRQAYDPDPIVQMVRYLYADRVRAHDGDVDFGYGIGCHWVGGHTHGLQVVSVATAGGTVVLASDAAHYYANMERRNPFPLLHDIGDTFNGWQRLEELAGENGKIIPGHDPKVAENFGKLNDAVDIFVLH